MGFKPAQISDGVWISPQIALDNLPQAAALGVCRIVNHRPDGEEAGQPPSVEIERAAHAAGLHYVHAPVAGMPGPDAIQATARALAEGVPVLMFCRSGMRSAVAWALAMRALDRADADTLRNSAASVGYDLSRLPL